MRFYIIYFIVFSVFLYSSNEVGCLSITDGSKDKKSECSEDSLLDSKREIIDLDILKADKRSTIHRVNITESISSVDVKFRGRLFTIERKFDRDCPPFCISAYKIKGIKGVGELETIDFIKSLPKGRRILVDARDIVDFENSTIPTAINIPYSIIDPNSKYRDEVLELLGAVKLKRGWFFKRSYKLLIFDNGILDNRAEKLIDRLLKYGYPKRKILYYRGGLSSWKGVGLNTI
jgi:hypothetical protein